MEERPGQAMRKPWLNGILFILTFASTFGVGLDLSLSYVYPDSLLTHTSATGPGLQAFLEPRLVALSLLYAGVLMTILTAHELGHYLTCRKYGLAATLPFFLPAPNLPYFVPTPNLAYFVRSPSLFGTFGAFIKINPINRKRQLFDVGAAGPLAGFVLSVPALWFGLAFSKVVPGALGKGSLTLGEPLLFKIGSALILGPIPDGSDIVLHPAAFAGWVGMLVTSLNLLPIGQLDGGHVAYALLGGKRKLASSIALAALVVLALFYFSGWLIWGIIGFAFALVVRLKRPVGLYRLATRLVHPPIQDERAPLGRGRTILGLILILIFILSFIPDPIKGMSLLGLFK